MGKTSTDSASSSTSVIDPESALEPYDPTLGHGPWGSRQVAHLLNRAVGGPKPGQMQQLIDAGPFQALDLLFEPDQDVLEAAWMGIGEPLAAAGDRAKLAAWWLMKMVQDDRVTGSRLTLFWHDHFATTWSKVQSSPLMYEQHLTFLDKGAGSFGDLLQAMMRDPAMLRFLDNDSNRRGLPNENLARELMELFSLGVGHYDEEDVQEASRALTGRSVRKGSYRFVELHHDPKPKKVLDEQVMDGDDLVAVVLKQDACPKFLVRKFWEFYVGPRLEEELQVLLAERWREQDLDVTWLLRTMLGSRAFHDTMMVSAKVKSPVDLVVGTMRSLGGRPDPKFLEMACARMGQVLFEPPGVQGWEGGEAWVHTAAWIERTRFADDVAQGKRDYLRKAPLQQLFPTSRRAIVAEGLDDMLRALIPGGIAPSRRRALLANLEAMGRTPEQRRFEEMAYAILCLPEYHLS